GRRWMSGMDGAGARAALPAEASNRAGRTRRERVFMALVPYGAPGAPRPGGGGRDFAVVQLFRREPRLGCSMVPVQRGEPQWQAQSFLALAVCGSSRTMP